MNRRAVDYLGDIREAASLLRVEEIEAGAALLAEALHDGRGVYICGNGGSASTASHLAVDLGKNLVTGPGKRMHVVSLTDNVPWLTALANDAGYADCFAEQLRNYLQPNDVLVGISASGDSENVVRAFELARAAGASRLALIGFDGGRLKQLATRSVWVPSHDYGIVESIHLMVAHIWVRMLDHEAPAGVSLVTQKDQPRAQVRPAPTPAITGLPLGHRERPRRIRNAAATPQTGA
ncbi:MAG: SIS domain-containing protein [Planctomycetes bacterium]|nr:SIS domain-containing protein [Planctomycetota bacterium]